MVYFGVIVINFKIFHINGIFAEKYTFAKKNNLNTPVPCSLGDSHLVGTKIITVGFR